MAILVAAAEAGDGEPGPDQFEPAGVGPLRLPWCASFRTVQLAHSPGTRSPHQRRSSSWASPGKSTVKSPYRTRRPIELLSSMVKSSGGWGKTVRITDGGADQDGVALGDDQDVDGGYPRPGDSLGLPGRRRCDKRQGEDKGQAGQGGHHWSGLNKPKFKVLPRRWVVEQPFASLGRNRRPSGDYEATIKKQRGVRRTGDVAPDVTSALQKAGVRALEAFSPFLTTGQLSRDSPQMRARRVALRTPPAPHP